MELEQRQEEDGGSFRVVQWNTLADGNLPVSESIRAGDRDWKV